MGTKYYVSECVLCIWIRIDKRRDIWSNIALHLREFRRPKAEGNIQGEGLYLTIYPESSRVLDLFLVLLMSKYMTCCSLEIQLPNGIMLAFGPFNGVMADR